MPEHLPSPWGVSQALGSLKTAFSTADNNSPTPVEMTEVNTSSLPHGEGSREHRDDDLSRVVTSSTPAMNHAESGVPHGGASSTPVRPRGRRRLSTFTEIPIVGPGPDKGLLPPVPSAERGSMHVIDQAFESLDYDTCPNQLYLKERLSTSARQSSYLAAMRMVVCFFTGVFTAVVAVCIDVVIHYGGQLKFSVIHKYFDTDFHPSIVFFLWMTLNMAFVLPAALLGSYVETVSAGSGIPQVKCYLNGVKVPRVVRIKTLLCKAAGVTCSVLGGLFVGKEGPMIHSGAVIAAGISQGKSTTFGKDFNFFHRFREDHEKRDFVACGAAAGVSAAFGAPIGGVLFALEEGASHWQQVLTWNSFVAAGTASAVLNLLLSVIYNKPRGGMLDFGAFENLDTKFSDPFVFVTMAAFLGVWGGTYNFANKYITMMRMRLLRKWWQRVLEVLFVAMMTAVATCTLIFVFPDCKVPHQKISGNISYPVTSLCEVGEVSMTARLFLATPEQSLVNLFHDPYGTYGIPILSIHFVVTSVLACYTYGLGVPSGVFIPTLLNGASFGRLCGAVITLITPEGDESSHDEGKYALAGAAALLAGVVRMTLSLTCIIMESSGAVTFTISLIVVIYVAKYVGDRFNQGLYDIHIRLNGVPFLEWHQEAHLENLFTDKVMNSPPLCLRPVESVRRLLLIARQCTHNGFPVVWERSLTFRDYVSSSDSKLKDSGRESDDTAEIDVVLARKGGRDSVDGGGPSTRRGHREETGALQNLMRNMRRKNRSVNLDESIEDDYDDEIDAMLSADPVLLKNHYAKQNASSGLDSAAVTSHLLTDSCIHRFSSPEDHPRDIHRFSSPVDHQSDSVDNVFTPSPGDIPSLSYNFNSSSAESASPRKVRDEENTTDAAMPLQGSEEGSAAGGARASSLWYNTTPAPPCLDESKSRVEDVQGWLCGLMLRSQIMVMLKHKMFIEKSEYWSDAWQDLRLFRDAYPRYYDLEAVDLCPEDLDCHVDLRPYMNPAPHTAPQRMSLSRLFDTFRSLGLRHLVAVDNSYRVKGIVTRKDLVKFHAKVVSGVVHVSRMNVHESV